ncbi:putative molybdopterin binding domain containing protein [Aphelenchoides avenae]|nr:putative molybdopterin binding domain containing protein [Aphelenchus avenae]
MRVSVLTVSDSSSRDNSQDKSGPLLVELLKTSTKIQPVDVVGHAIVPDDVNAIFAALESMYGRKDVTPEATKKIIEKECPGIVTALLMRSLQATPMAALTRLAAGVAGQCLIVNLPGSPKAVRECFEVLEGILRHAVAVIRHDQKSVVEAHHSISATP